MPLLKRFDDDLKEAARQRMSHATLLTHVVEQEYRLKCDRARQQRLQRARLPEPWTIENGLLTPTLKVRRRIVENEFAALVEAMYREEESY